MQLDGGETSYNDGGDMHAALAFGKAFADGKMHEVFGSEYEDSQTIGFCGEVRPWCAQGYAEFTNSGYLTNGPPHYVIGPVARATIPQWACLTRCPRRASSASSTMPARRCTVQSGHVRHRSPFTATQDGSGPNFYDNVTIRPPVTHWSLYSHTSFEVTSSLEASLDISFAQRRATNIQGSDGTGFPVNVIFPNNAYLPPSVAAAMGGFPAFRRQHGR